MRAEHQNALDVAGAARAGHQRDHRGPVPTVQFLQPLERGRQVADQLIASGQHHVVRRQHTQGPASRGPAVDHQRSGLRHQHIAGGDAGFAGLQLVGHVAAIGEQGGSSQRGRCGVGQRRVVAGDSFPAFAVGDAPQLLMGFGLRRHAPEVGLQFGRGGGEAGQLFLQCGAARR